MAQEVQPGNAPTKAVGAAVPEMKTECADGAAPGTEATEATGKAVPEMKGDAKKGDACLKPTPNRRSNEQ